MANNNRNNQNNQQANPDDNTEENKNGQENKKADKPKAPKKNLTRVRFNRAHTPYLKGEVAGIEPEMAKKLIEAKICSKA